MKCIEKLNQLVETWSNTDLENKNEIDKIQREIVEIRNRIEDYPIELVNMSKSIELLKNREESLDNYIMFERYLKFFEKYHIKYNKSINLMEPNIDEIIQTVWQIKEEEYCKNPKYDTGEIKRIIRELSD